MEPLKESSMNDLNLDRFKIIMKIIAQSNDANDLARASCISKGFNEAAEDEAVLNFVKLGDRCSSEYSPSFWNTEGLVHRCAQEGIFSAKYLILEVYLEKLAALEAENTMERYNVALLALEELEEITNNVKKENDEILKQFKTFK